MFWLEGDEMYPAFEEYKALLAALIFGLILVALLEFKIKWPWSKKSSDKTPPKKH